MSNVLAEQGPQSFTQFFALLTSCSCDDDSNIKCDSTFHRRVDEMKGIVKQNCYWDKWETEYCKWFLSNDAVWRQTLKPESIKSFSDWGFGLLDAKTGRVDGSDLGIDLVAEGYDGTLWGIQAKCYKNNDVTKSHIDSFISALNSKQDSRSNSDPAVTFDKGLLLTTTNVGKNGINTIRNQANIEVTVVSPERFILSDLDWSYATTPEILLPEPEKISITASA